MKNQLLTFLLVTLLGVFSATAQAGRVEENPGGFVMAGDLLVARPIGLVVFALGSVAFVVSLPFSALGGNIGDAGKTLVVAPAREVFVRCLGCRSTGRKAKISN
ncbi:MAG: hypothetical protein ABGY96_21040 [bacterium]|nr:hypothetical protein [Gammaproteobacteria bacterium]HIL95407.1 hypothetical protein [Pseudomonadales bacterium]